MVTQTKTPVKKRKRRSARKAETFVQKLLKPIDYVLDVGASIYDYVENSKLRKNIHLWKSMAILMALVGGGYMAKETPRYFEGRGCPPPHASHRFDKKNGHKGEKTTDCSKLDKNQPNKKKRSCLDILKSREVDCQAPLLYEHWEPVYKDFNWRDVLDKNLTNSN